MEAVKDKLLAVIENTRRVLTEKNGMDPAEHVLARIKSEESMREKCRRQGLPETEESALVRIHDAVGLRVVCAFLDDVYAMRDALASADGVEIVQEKDYIRAAKPNVNHEPIVIVPPMCYNHRGSKNSNNSRHFLSKIFRRLTMDNCTKLVRLQQWSEQITATMASVSPVLGSNYSIPNNRVISQGDIVTSTFEKQRLGYPLCLPARFH